MVKRYGCVFTYLAMHVVHIEIAHSLNAESFLCAFSSFAARRGLPTNMYSNNGTNFVRASGILKDEFSNIWSDKEQSKIYNQLRQKGVTWHFNPPLASHAGGVWEQIIQSIRRILTALTTEQTLDDKSSVSEFILEALDQ